MYNIIGDIAGQWKTFEALVAKMPPAPVLSVGDMIDRGPDSDKVVSFFMETPGAEVLLGNHEHMMIDHCERGGFYQEGLWTYNGGDATLKSYAYHVPNEVVQWAKGLPKFKVVEVDGKKIFIAHSFMFNRDKVQSMTYHPDDFEDSIIWNRWHPNRVDEYDLQIAGHNSQWGLKRFSDDRGEFAIGIDTSRTRVLTGIHLPTMAVYQQEYIK